MSAKAPRVETILSIFEHRLGIHVPTADTDLFAAGLLDSLAFIDLVLHLETEFGTPMPLEQLDLEAFSSVSRIAALIEDPMPLRRAAGG